MKHTIYIVVGIIVLIGVSVGISKIPSAPGEYDDFAMCIADSGATFYGAFWCPHCNDQKALFGKSAKKLPYVECSTPDGRGQLAVCKEAGIEGYPAWDFENGERIGGSLSFETLAEQTGCALPEITHE